MWLDLEEHVADEFASVQALSPHAFDAEEVRRFHLTDLVDVVVREPSATVEESVVAKAEREHASRRVVRECSRGQVSRQLAHYHKKREAKLRAAGQTSLLDSGVRLTPGVDETAKGEGDTMRRSA